MQTEKMLTLLRFGTLQKQYSSYEEWGNYITKCPIQEICPRYSKKCTEDKVQWKDLATQLQNSKEIVIMDYQNLQEATVDFPLHQNDLDELKRYICDMTLIQIIAVIKPNC